MGFREFPFPFARSPVQRSQRDRIREKTARLEAEVVIPSIGAMEQLGLEFSRLTEIGGEPLSPRPPRAPHPNARADWPCREWPPPVDDSLPPDWAAYRRAHRG